MLPVRRIPEKLPLHDAEVRCSLGSFEACGLTSGRCQIDRMFAPLRCGPVLSMFRSSR